MASKALRIRTMTMPYIPPHKPIPDGATKEERRKMYEEYKALLIRSNPHLMNPDGTFKSFWQSIKYSFKR